MLPTFDLGPWHIRTYGALASLAVILVGMIGFHRLRQLGLPTGVVIRGGVWLFLGGLAGIFLAYCLPKLEHLPHTGTLDGRQDGLSITWGMVGAAAVAIALCRKYKIPLGRAFDLGGLACPLGLVIARLGCLAAGCCGGRATDVWPGMYLPDVRGVWLMRYPTQLMHAAANLLIFLGLVALERYGLHRSDKPPGSRTWPFDGFIFSLFVVLFFLQRFVIAFFREQPAPVLGPFSWMHLHAIIGVTIVTALILWNLVRSSPPQKMPET